MSSEYILEMVGIQKYFPGVKALDGVNLKVKKGGVHALMGENGAGKSTLMKILNGIYRPDKGSICLKGEEVRIMNSNDAIKKGLAMIHQELTPVPHMTIAETFFSERKRKKVFLQTIKKCSVRRRNFWIVWILISIPASRWQSCRFPICRL